MSSNPWEKNGEGNGDVAAPVERAPADSAQLMRMGMMT